MLEELETQKNNPQPKPRKHPHLFQMYLWYREFLEIRKSHLLRISAIERGSSNMDAELERQWIVDLGLDKAKKDLGKALAKSGASVGPVWEWLTNIKGCKSGLLPAQLLAQIDDISRFETISALWRFCGYAVFNNKAEPKTSFQAPHDEYSGRHYSGRLKGTCFNIAETFIKMQTPGYVDIYYAHKQKQRDLHPMAVCRKCQIDCNVKIKKIGDKEVEVFTCPNNSKHVKDFSDSHIHYRAIRKMMKAFLKDLWLVWREFEGLSITDKWEG